MIQKGEFDVRIKLQYQEVRPRSVEPAVGASPCLRFGERNTRCPTHRW